MAPSWEETTLRKLYWAVLPITCIMIGCCYLDRSNVAYMQLQLRHPPPVGLSFSSSLYGNAAGLFFVSYSLFQIPSTLIVSWLGAPLWLAITVVLWGMAAALMATVRGPAAYLTLRLLLGVFESGTFPAVWHHLMLFFPLKNLTVPFAMVAVAIMVAQVLSAPIAAALMSLHGALGLQGWQWIALVEGVVTIAIGVILKFTLPASPEEVKSLSEEELMWVRQHVARPKTSVEMLRGVRIAAQSRHLWHLTLIFTAKSFAVFALIFWIPIVVSDLLERTHGDVHAYGHTRGQPPVPSAGPGTDDIHDRGGGTGTGLDSGASRQDLLAVALTTVPYACAAVAAYLLGWSSEARNERRMHTFVPFVVASAVLLAAPLLQGPEMAVPAFLALTVALSLCNSTAAVTSCVPVCLPPEARTSGLAVFNSASGVGSYLGPAVFGWLKAATGSNAPGMVVMGCVLLASAAAVWLFDEESAAWQGDNTQENGARDKSLLLAEAPFNTNPPEDEITADGSFNAWWREGTDPGSASGQHNCSAKLSVVSAPPSRPGGSRSEEGARLLQGDSLDLYAGERDALQQAQAREMYLDNA